MMWLRLFCVAGLTATALAGCGGGGGGGTGTNLSSQPSAAGIWQATNVVTSGVNTGDTIKEMALVAPSGNFYIAGVNQNNGCAGVGFGQISLSGTNITGNGVGAVVRYATIPGVNTNCTFPDGSISATEQISGTVSTGQSLVITSTGTTSAGNNLGTDTSNYSWSNLNSITPSLSSVAGNYVDSAGNSIIIGNNGGFSGVDQGTGCSYTGLISVPSQTVNVYNVSVTYSGCPLSYASLNGVTLAGLGFFDNTVTPNKMGFGLSGSVNGKTVIFVGNLAKQ